MLVVLFGAGFSTARDGRGYLPVRMHGNPLIVILPNFSRGYYLGRKKFGR